MNSLYLHIPYCISRCGYCDFHSSTCLDDKDQYIRALCLEIRQRRDYLDGDVLDTIYFGGGTPSLLSRDQFETIFNTIAKYYTLAPDAEITLEANPNDISESYMNDLRSVGFNRISIGIQSFDDSDLRVINRRHSAQEAIEAVTLAKQAGFDNISIDLIFALPLQTLASWQANLEQAFVLGVQHISSYNLIYEKGTAFDHKRQQGVLKELDDELSLTMYRALIEASQAHGFVHYETSNFALEGFYSRHNSNYWRGDAYLGVGAGAHSYNGSSRRWNVANNTEYITGIKSLQPVFEIEMVDKESAYNEFVMTGLRTMWGCDLDLLKQRFGDELLAYCLRLSQPFVEREQLKIVDNVMTITPQAIFVSDHIMSELMYVSR